MPNSVRSRPATLGDPMWQPSVAPWSGRVPYCTCSPVRTAALSLLILCFLILYEFLQRVRTPILLNSFYGRMRQMNIETNMTGYERQSLRSRINNSCHGVRCAAPCALCLWTTRLASYASFIQMHIACPYKYPRGFVVPITHTQQYKMQSPARYNPLLSARCVHMFISRTGKCIAVESVHPKPSSCSTLTTLKCDVLE